MRATLAAIARRIKVLWSGRAPRARAGWFLAAAIVCVAPTRAMAQVTVTISPSSVNLPASGSQQFTAIVTGASNTSVSWTIQEGSAGGAVSNSGLYVAPAGAGVYHVIATSTADNTKNSVATVGLPGFVQTGLLSPRPCTATALIDGTVLFTGGGLSYVTYVTSPAEIYNPATSTSTAPGSMTLIRCNETATALLNGQVLFAGGQTSGGTTATAELYDPVARTFTATGSMSVPRQGHTATLLSNGQVLIAGGAGNCGATTCYYNTAELFDPVTGTFGLTANDLATPYAGAAAIAFGSGNVLIVGGTSGGGVQNSVAELYNLSTGMFAPVPGIIDPPQGSTATLLQNGDILFAGGVVSGAITSAAEIYDPVAETFSSTGSLTIPRDSHSASVLSNGQVLIVGGISTSSLAATAELYDPVAGTFSLAGSLEEPRSQHTATLLPNGEILVAGGFGSMQALNSLETYDPNAKVFTSQSVFLQVPRTGQTTTQLADGRLLITGGVDATNNVYSSAEIYDPASGQFLLTGPMTQARHGHTGTLLGNGDVLVVGGFSDIAGPNNGSVVVPSAEIYSPSAGTFSPAPSSPNIARGYHTGTLLQSGLVLIAGGLTDEVDATSTVELYDPVAQTFTLAGNMSAPRFNHTATLFNDGQVLLVEGITQGGTPGNGIGPDDLYDPTSGTFTQVGTPRQFSTPTIPPFDSVQLANGLVLADDQTIFNPLTNTLSTISSLVNLSAILQDYKFALLPNEQVFATSNGYTTYLFDPTAQTYTASASLQYLRTSPTLKLLPNDEVLVAGGASVAEVEFYVPPVAAINPAPVILGISPSSAVAGTAGFTLVVAGANFLSNSVVNFNGAARTTTFDSSQQIKIAISMSDIASPGTVTITVSNPSNGAGGVATSNPATLTILAPNVQPVVGALIPASATAGGPAFMLTITGNNFTTNSVVTFGGNIVQSAFLSAEEVQANIPASAIAVAGTPLVTVSNQGSSPSIVVTFTVNNPFPQETLLSPSTASVGSAALALSVTGAYFSASSGILINGAAIPTKPVSSTLLTATIPASDLAQAGTLNVSVNNLAPGGGTTAALPFTVVDANPQPVVGALVPASATAGGSSFMLSIAGNNFTANSVVTFGGNMVQSAFSSAGQLQATIPASAIAVAGTRLVTVANPGSSPSIVATFTVNNPVPQESSLSQTSATAGSAALPFNLAGTNFNASSSIQINGTAVPTTLLSSTQLQASLPANDLAKGGTLNVSVNNPAPGGGTTLPLPFTVNNPAPQESLLSPASAMAGSPALPLNVTGTNFNASSSIQINGTALATMYVSSTQLQASVPASEFAQGGTLSIAVTNPIPGGGTTAGISFAVEDYSLTPPSSFTPVMAGLAAIFPLTLSSTNGVFSNPVTLGIPQPSQLPAGTSYSFSPSAIVTPGANSQIVVLSITTTQHTTSSAPRFPSGDRDILLVLFLVAIALALAVAALRASGRCTRRLAPQLLLTFLLAVAAGLVACTGGVGGGGEATTSTPPLNPATGTPAGTYQISVTATSGSVSQSTTVTLTVM